MSFETLAYEKQGTVGVLKINRPKALNALNAQVITELGQFLEEIKDDKELRCLVVTGAGDKAFVAGADIKEMSEMTKEEALEMSEKGQRLFLGLENLSIPSIAAVNGFALGGGLELALSCDFIVASEKAKMGLPEVTLGLIPGYGGTQRLSRSIGKAKARMMTLTGNIFSAQQAYDWGLAAQLFSPEELLDGALKIAKDISQRGPVALSLAKRAMNEGYDKNLFEAMKLEAELFSETFQTADKSEGVKAFVEKRAPQFTGQ